ncbi:MAG TPA: kelch repeat-containing protein [Puia sp.]|nr:kelch repeat-containing protein [Puia sp.]
MKNPGSVSCLFISIFFNISFAQAQKPEPRFLSLSVYDSANKQVILFGGENDKGYLKDLWAYKKSKWKKLDSLGPGIIKCAFAYDIHRKKIVLFGGSGKTVTTDETWEWDGSHWVKIDLPGPSTRNHPMSVYSPKDKSVILFGGSTVDAHLLTDTWAYDGLSWKLMDNDGPKDCLPHGMYYDEKRQKVMLVTLSETNDSPDPTRTINKLWEWTGKSWKNIQEGNMTTSQHGLQALARFGEDGILLFDGGDISDGHGKTWTYSAGHWQSQQGNGPSSRSGHAMIYDPLTRKTILFGGQDDRKNYLNDLWEWDGTIWHKIN